MKVFTRIHLETTSSFQQESNIRREQDLNSRQSCCISPSWLICGVSVVRIASLQGHISRQENCAVIPYLSNEYVLDDIWREAKKIKYVFLHGGFFASE